MNKTNQNKYFICRRIETVAHLFDLSVDCNNFEFSGYDSSDPTNIQGRGLVAKKFINAKNFHEAAKIFSEELTDVLDGLSFTTQCYFEHASNPTYIKKINNNNENIIFINVSRNKKGVGMPIDYILEDSEKLINSSIKDALHFLRLANNSIDPKNRYSMLVIAGESLAGTKKEIKNCTKCNNSYEYPTTNKDKLIEIFGEKIVRENYTQHGAYRPKLFHGKKVKDIDIINISNEMHNKILNYLKNEFNLKNVSKIKNPPRSPFAFEQGITFVKSQLYKPPLKDINDKVLEVIDNYESGFKTGGYEILVDRKILEELRKTY